MRVAAKLSVCRGTDRSATTSRVTTSSAALLQREQLLSTEGLVVNLAGSFDQVLQVSAGEEVTQVNKFAVALVLDVNHTPTVLASANLLAIDDDSLLTSDNGEGNDFLYRTSASCPILSATQYVEI